MRQKRVQNSVYDPITDRTKVVEWLKCGEQKREELFRQLVAKAEQIVVMIMSKLALNIIASGKLDGFVGGQVLEAKYGENGLQTIYWKLYCYRRTNDPLAISNFKEVIWTAPSYNNLADVDRLLQTVTHIAAGFDVNGNTLSASDALGISPREGEGSAVPKNCLLGVKHGNPCGAAVSENPHEAIQKMLEGDLRAIFGGVVMVNFTVDEVAAEILLSYQMPEGQRRLLDGIIAPDFSAAAIEMLKRKGDKCRFLGANLRFIITNKKNHWISMNVSAMSAGDF